jgi:hypothetical protein
MGFPRTMITVQKQVDDWYPRRSQGRI